MPPLGTKREYSRMTTCKYGDSFCPCQDGDICHYEGPDPMVQPDADPRRFGSPTVGGCEPMTVPRDPTQRVVEALRIEWFKQRAEGAEANDWYGLARAAVDALQLTEEWGVGVQLDGGAWDVNANRCFSPADARKLLRSLNAAFPDDRRRVVRRFTGGPWVEEQQ